MNAPNARSASAPRITPAQWDELRASFRQSLLADTSISALADNIDGCNWPKKGPEEIPATYLELTHEEALARFASLNLSAAHLDKLADILRGTLAFDESFGEMVDIASRAEAGNDPIKRNLERLGIPENFPIALCNFTPDTRALCQAERLEVIADFLAFSRDVSRSAIIAGEYRELLNAFVEIDEHVIARYLPYRLKTSGLYLLEGLAHIVRALDADTRALLRKDPASALAPEVLAQADGMARHFYIQLDQILNAYEAGTPVNRLVAPLDEIETEGDVAALLTRYLPVPASAPAAAPAPAEPVAVVAEPAPRGPAKPAAPGKPSVQTPEPAKKQGGFLHRLFGRR